MKNQKNQFEENMQNIKEAIEYKAQKTNTIKIIKDLTTLKQDLEKMERGTGNKELLKEDAHKDAKQVKVTAQGQTRIQEALKMLKAKYPDYKVPGYDEIVDDIFTKTIGETVHDKIFLKNLIEAIEAAKEEYNKDVDFLTEQIDKRCPDNNEAKNNQKIKRKTEKTICCAIF